MRVPVRHDIIPGVVVISRTQVGKREGESRGDLDKIKITNLRRKCEQIRLREGEKYNCTGNKYDSGWQGRR